MRRIAELDGLRGLSAILIVLYHLFTQLRIARGALDVFFVLSGYLITSIVIQYTFSWRFLGSFYIRRGLRIWPIYYLAVLVLALAGLADQKVLPYYLTYTQESPRYWGGVMPLWGPMEHTWSLALEEQFYLIWPLLVLWAGRRRMRYLALAIAASAIVMRHLGIHWWLLLARCDGFALGGFLAIIMADKDADRARHRVRNWVIAFAIAAALQAVLLNANGGVHDRFEPIAVAARATLTTLGAFILVALVVCHAGHPRLAILRLRPLVYLGTISYGVYLYHYPIIKLSGLLTTYVGDLPRAAIIIVDCLLTLLIAVASWHLIEQPILRLKDRIPYRRDPAALPYQGSPAFAPASA
jgi:peptidoglycan/LPS O-acetylase OafA/YrhL